MRDLVVAFSAANLAFIAVWRRLILASPADRFWTRVPAREDALAAILNVLLLGTLLWVLLVVSRRAARLDFLRAAPPLVLLIPLSTVFGGNGPLETFGHYGLWAVYIIAFLLGVLVLGHWRAKVAGLILIFSPFLLFTLSQAGWMALNPPPAEVPGRTLAGYAPERSGTRVLMIIFDEMEQRLAFNERPAGLELPNLDRLRAESLAAHRALPPGNGTHISIPSLLTGRTVIAARPENASELFIRYHDVQEPVRLTAEPTLFRDLYRDGIRTAVVGWHLPYCRIFGQYLANCFAQPRRDPVLRQRSVAGAMRKQVQSLFYLLERGEHILEYQSLLEHANTAVASPEYDFVYLHLPVPHGPPAYDRALRRLTIRNLSDEWYLDNLALADRALGELRAAMERAGLWERTAVVLTSDHVWLLAHKYHGTRDDRVPFLVRLPGSGGVSYPHEISALAAHDVVRELLAGRITAAEELLRLLDAHVSAR